MVRRDREELLSATMTVETTGEIKQLFLEFQSMGVQFCQALHLERVKVPASSS